MIFNFEIDNLLRQQLYDVKLWHKHLPKLKYTKVKDFPMLVSIQNQINFELWHQEDLARDPEVSDTKIANVKRAIDQLNQKRNDLIEEMDPVLVAP